jgi:hypothetical protein
VTRYGVEQCVRSMVGDRHHDVAFGD